MNKPLILVVEDDAPVRSLITTTLRAHDYRFLSAANGESAILEASSHNPDIMLLDLGLPDLDGVEVIHRVRTWSNLPIIVISARSEDTDKIEALDAGADDYLTKPFSSVVLHSVVNRLMANKKELKDYYYSPESAYEQSGGQLIHQEDKEFMDSVTAIIKENLAQDILRPELIADKLGTNTRALYRRFKKISPLTPSDFIKDYRMKHAAQLLVTTNLSVQEIIYQVGISNKSYFYREFSAKYGVTPGQYRQMQ